jgi:hypothetical protein
MEGEKVEKTDKMLVEDRKFKFHQRSVSEISAWEDGNEESFVLWKKPEIITCGKGKKLEGDKGKKFSVRYSKVEKKVKVPQQVFKLPEIKSRETGLGREAFDVLFSRRKSNEASIVRINEFCGSSIRVTRNIINPSLILHENLRIFSSVKKNNLRIY